MNPGNMKCRQLIPKANQIPLGRSSHTCSIVGDALYVFGGENQPRVPVDNTLHVFSLRTHAWDAITSEDAPSSRVGVSSCSVDGKFYIFGGRCGTGMGEGDFNDFYCYDPSVCSWKKIELRGQIPMARSFHSMAAIEKEIFVFGGCGKDRFNDLHSFNTETGYWTKLYSSSDVSARGGAGLVAVGDCLYVVGGFDGSELSDMHCYNRKTNQWKTIHARGFPPTSVFTITSLESVIYVFGGEVAPSQSGHSGAGVYTNCLYSFDTRDDSGSWKRRTLEGTLPSPRGWMSGSRHAARWLVHGGNGEDNGRLNQLYEIQLNDDECEAEF